MPAIFENLPSLYREVLPPTFATDIPDESKATCSNCAMCASNCEPSISAAQTNSENTATHTSSNPSDSSTENTFFEPSVKCCTFHPTLPNYLVGAILSDTSPENAEGRVRILEKIRDRIGVTPYGIAAPAKYTLLYGNSREFFGRSSSMLCPYFINEGGGLCSIWRYRDAVCSTYFCKHVAGADGRRFWMQLKSHMALIENQLSRYTIYQLYPEYLLSQKHPSEPPSRKLEREELEDKPPSGKYYSALWEGWAGMESEFYEECYRLVQQLTPEKVSEIVGLDGQISLHALEQRLTSIVQPKLPNRLRMNANLSVRWLTNGEVIVGAYSELDALALPEAGYRLLQEFRGDQSVQDVRNRLRKERQTDFSDDVLLSLYQHRVLEEC